MHCSGSSPHYKVSSRLRSPTGFSGRHTDDDMDAGDAALVLASSEPRILDSHAISDSAAAALRDGDAEVFIKTRLGDLRSVVEDFVDARADWERPTRPAVAAL